MLLGLKYNEFINDRYSKNSSKIQSDSHKLSSVAVSQNLPIGITVAKGSRVKVWDIHKREVIYK